MDVAELIAAQRRVNSDWWQQATRLQWSIQSAITEKGYFLIGRRDNNSWLYGVFRVIDDLVEPATPLIYSRFVAFRRMRKLDRQAS